MDVFVVLLAKGGGEVATVKSTAALALSYVTAIRPPCNYSIVQKTIDDAGETNIQQGYQIPPALSGVVKQGHRNQ